MALIIIAVLPILIAGAYFQTRFMTGASTLVSEYTKHPKEPKCGLGFSLNPKTLKPKTRNSMEHG